jgi:hypothetical protein
MAIEIARRFMFTSSASETRTSSLYYRAARPTASSDAGHNSGLHEPDDPGLSVCGAGFQSLTDFCGDESGINSWLF